MCQRIEILFKIESVLFKNFVSILFKSYKSFQNKDGVYNLKIVCTSTILIDYNKIKSMNVCYLPQLVMRFLVYSGTYQGRNV